MQTLDLLVEHSRLITEAWEQGHEDAAKLYGSNAASYFTGPLGNALMAELEAQPLTATADDFAKIVQAHLAESLP